MMDSLRGVVRQGTESVQDRQVERSLPEVCMLLGTFDSGLYRGPFREDLGGGGVTGVCPVSEGEEHVGR